MPSDNFSEYDPNEPTAETIIARAQARIAARRANELAPRNDKPWRWLLPVVVVGVLTAFLFAPGPLPQTVLLAMGGVCGLRPTHSYFAAGVQLPLEARMNGQWPVVRDHASTLNTA